jgi:hypothetical protein
LELVHAEFPRYGYFSCRWKHPRTAPYSLTEKSIETYRLIPFGFWLSGTHPELLLTIHSAREEKKYRLV